jgi:formamidopyrimidine-DNA glycosylase
VGGRPDDRHRRRCDHPAAIRRTCRRRHFAPSCLAGRSSTSPGGQVPWLPLDSGDAIIAHLGMSGQLLMRAGRAAGRGAPAGPVTFTDGGPQLRFVDQRTFGGLSVSEGGAELPAEIAHIARDPMDPLFDDEAFVARLRGKHTEVKRALLDQTLISGVGNIYADEALWRAAAARRPAHRRAHRRPSGGCSATSATCSARRSSRAAPASTRSTSTSTARAATSTGR